MTLILISIVIPLLTLVGIYFVVNRPLNKAFRNIWPKAIDDPRAMQMPAELIREEPRKVKSLAVGERAYIFAGHVTVSETGGAFLDDEVEIRIEAEGPLDAKIERTSDGLRLTLRGDHVPQYRRRRLYSSLTYLPVTEILIEQPKRGGE
jgi:hypothetical protein